MNLLRNGMEAMGSIPRERRGLVVQTRRCSADLIEIAVQDGGPGLPEDLGERIFNPFFTTKATGMGMGLAISRSIAEMHGGRLWAGPNPAGGTTFRFTLPVIHEPGKGGRARPGRGTVLR